MVATASSLRPPPAGLLPAAERHFGTRLRAAERLEGGYANHVFRVESEKGPLALRAAHPPVDARDLRWEHDVVRRVEVQVPEVVAPLAAPDGSTFVLHDGWAASLLPFVPGRPADRGDARVRDAAAQLLGRLHAAAETLDAAARPRAPALRDLTWPRVGAFRAASTGTRSQLGAPGQSGGSPVSTATCRRA